MTTTTAPAAPTTPHVEIERHDDATYVFVDGEFTGSVTPRWSLGAPDAVVSGWFVRDERGDGVSHGVRMFRRQAEASLSYYIGVAIPRR